MKKVFLTLFAIFLALANANAQTDFRLNAGNEGTTKYTCNAYFYDNAGGGNYAANQDRYMTFCPGSASQRINMTFEQFVVDATDTFFLYDGPSITSPIMYDIVNTLPYFQGSALVGKTIVGSPNNTSGCLTARFVSDGSHQAAGWKAKISCETLCQDVVSALDTFYMRYNEVAGWTTRTLKIDTAIELQAVAGSLPYDTIIDNNHYKRDTVSFYALDLCEGDSLVIFANPLFAYNDLQYHQSKENCIYYWSFGDGNEDTTYYNPQIGHYYETMMGYDLNLIVTDTSFGGCTSKNAISARVRIAPNPIKTVAKLPDMCSGEKQLTFVGYSAMSTIIIDSIQFNQTAHQSFDTRMFIPDGGASSGGTMGCYNSPVQFTVFGPNAKVNTAEDVLDVCMSIEHSYIGDLGFWLVCPNGQAVTLKYNTHQNGQYLGNPNHEDGYPITDSNANPIGTCWTYCFSNIYLDNAQGVISGLAPNHVSNNTIDSTHYPWDETISPEEFFQTPIQGLPSGATAAQCTTVDLNGFEELIGCPLNGEWTLRICDNWGADNGWVCSWWMDLGANSGAGWTYQVPLDTVLWTGPFLTDFTPSTAIIAPPVDSCGQFTYDISIIDAFGCPWDTNTTLNVVCTPIVDLGPDRESCEGFGITLDAGNPGATSYNWEPTGETTQAIFANPGANQTGINTYYVQVTNYNGLLYCYGSDTINLNIFPSAQAAFTTDNFPLEGCEPFEFKLVSASTNAAQYEWQIGDETSSLANPTFTFPYGTYDIKLKITTENGCQDSVHYEDIITVFKNPIANFGWEPSVPYASNPTVAFINQTTPESTDNFYIWQFQTNKNNENDIINVTSKNPKYKWHPQSGESVAGEYNVTLDAYTLNEGPSGRVYECHDTITKVVTIINDNILFPTVVSPNGDGQNDVFFIRNLIDGQAFPDNELAIYNRHGKMIYFVEDIRNEEDFWDPNKTNSPTGTYFYRFVGKGPIRNVEFKGSVEVLR